MQLKATGQAILNQVFELTSQLSDDEYAAELELLNDNTIGKHVRHIIEFFDLLISGSTGGIINYDRRKHEPTYETSVEAGMQKLRELMKALQDLSTGKEILLEVSYADSDEDPVKIKSSVERELAYNIEHAIHHMAIIKIAVQTVFPRVGLAENFGVAYSTVRYQKSSGE
jgi:uncharacterized damage-inducible protein DinB